MNQHKEDATVVWDRFPQHVAVAAEVVRWKVELQDWNPILST